MDGMSQFHPSMAICVSATSFFSCIVIAIDRLNDQVTIETPLRFTLKFQVSVYFRPWNYYLFFNQQSK